MGVNILFLDETRNLILFPQTSFFYIETHKKLKC